MMLTKFPRLLLPGIPGLLIRFGAFLIVTVSLSACIVREKQPPVLLTPMQTAEQLILLEISPTAAEVITDHTGDIKPNAALTRYMDSIANRLDTSVRAKLIRYGYGLVVSLPARGEHTPRFNELLPTLQRETGLQIRVIGNSAYVHGSPRCARVTESTQKAVNFLLRHNVLSPRMLAHVTCDEVPTISFGQDDWERDERLEFVLYPSRSFANSITKADGATTQSKN